MKMLITLLFIMSFSAFADFVDLPGVTITGGATETKQDNIITELDVINASQGNVITELQTIVTNSSSLSMTEGDLTDFSSTNVLDSAFTDLITLSSNIKKMSIVHNGGGKFILRLNSVNIGYISPGEISYIDFEATSGDVVRIQSVSGTVSSGELYLNFFN